MSTFSLNGKKVCVVDAYALIYQVFHAPGMEMTNAFGEPTGAVFGFARDIIAIITKLAPDYLLCAYDMHAPTFRSEVYSEYKANRPPTPDDLLLQFDFTREFLKGVGVPALGVVGFEADDVMATVSRIVRELGGHTILATSDKDARQLISDSTELYLIRKEKFYRAQDLQNDWGIRPDQVVDFQALVGDASDNVPGVPLIGPKVASELLAKYGNLEGVFAGAVGQKGKRFENIRNGRELALLSRKLVTLRQDAPITIDWEKAQLGGVDPERLKTLFQYWNFRSLLAKIDTLVERLGTATAEPSEWVDAVEIKRREFLQQSDRKHESAPTLFAQARSNQPNTNARGYEPTNDAVIPQDSTLLERFFISQYGSRPVTDPEVVKRVKASQTSFAEFGLVAVDAFRSLAELELPERATHYAEPSATLVDSAEKLDALVDALRKVKTLAVAVVARETPEIGKVKARFATLTGLSLAYNTTDAFYLPFRAILGVPTLAREHALNALRPILEDPTIAKVGFDLKYDALVLLDAGVALRGLAFDVELADYLARSGETRRDLADLADAYLNARVTDLKSELGTGRNRVPLDQVAPQEIARYVAELTLVPMNVAPIVRDKILDNPALERLLLDLETPLVETLAEMEYNGIAIEPNVFRKASGELLERQNALENEIRALVATADPDPNFAQTMNLNSPKQLQRLLFDDLKLRVIKKTKTGPSVDAEVLEELAYEHPVPEKIVELRKLVKLRGTYLEPLPNQTLATTGRICATFNQTATATGRLSSSDPNLQNIPARSETGKLIRSGFIPDKTLGFDSLISCDYSQIELRVLAHYSGDRELQDAFRHDVDIHASVASRLFNVPHDQVTPDMRRKAKAVNFGLVYGQTAFGLSKSINVTTSEANEYIDSFFATYPGTLAFFDRVLEECARKGYVQTAFGRRRAIVGVRGPRGRQTLNFPERAAINAVVQGTAADIMKLAMVNVWRRLAREGWIASRWSRSGRAPEPVLAQDSVDAAPASLFAFAAPTPSPGPEAKSPRATSRPATNERARLLLQIHDELLFETRREDADELVRLVVEEMTLGNPLTVPLKIDAEIGDNWGEV